MNRLQRGIYRKEFIKLRTNSQAQKTEQMQIADDNIFFFRTHLFAGLKSTENGSSFWCVWTLASLFLYVDLMSVRLPLLKSSGENISCAYAYERRT